MMGFSLWLLAVMGFSLWLCLWWVSAFGIWPWWVSAFSFWLWWVSAFGFWLWWVSAIGFWLELVSAFGIWPWCVSALGIWLWWVSAFGFWSCWQVTVLASCSWTYPFRNRAPLFHQKAQSKVVLFTSVNLPSSSYARIWWVQSCWLSKQGSYHSLVWALCKTMTCPLHGYCRPTNLL